MFARARYQQGCLRKERRKSGPVWVFIFRETDASGQRHQRKNIIGPVAKFPTRAAALKETERLRVSINSENHVPRTMSELITHYELTELAEGGSKAYSTRHVYGSYIKSWIRPHWGEFKVSDVHTVPVERWLNGLDLANGSRAKIRNIMSAIFNHAIRWRFAEANPISGPVRGSGVRQSAEPEATKEVLTTDELKALLAELKEQHRTAVFLAAVTGLRVSELLALQWQDIDWDGMKIHLNRGIFHQHIGGLKTQASRKPLAMDTGLCEVLMDWRAKTPYNQPSDWLFASPEMHGKQPYWPDSLMRKVIRPAAVRAGIIKHVGWHTFRHSYATQLIANGEDIKTVQESLRHASVKVTLGIYAHAVDERKRAAQARVVQAIV